LELGGLLLYFTSLLTVAGIYAVIALGLNLNWGMSGLFNVGIAGFFAVGAYVSALLTARPVDAEAYAEAAVFLGQPAPVWWFAGALVSAGAAWAGLRARRGLPHREAAERGLLALAVLAAVASLGAAAMTLRELTLASPRAGVGGLGLPMPIGWVMAAAAAALVAWAVGRICLRLRSDYLAIATIGVAEIIRLVALNFERLTGGAVGVRGIARPFEGMARPWGEIALMLLVFAIVTAVYAFMQRARNSPWGRVMRAIRDNETAAAAMGKDVEAFRLQAFVIGAAFMGLGGALTAHYLKILTPEATEPLYATFLVWVMLIVGGSGNNRGAILGAVVVWIIWNATELLSGYLQGLGRIRIPLELLGRPDELVIDSVQLALRIAYLRMFLVGLLLVIVLQRFPGGLLRERPPRLAGERG
jgi:branched-chain amino acid transport system permease protein